MQDFPTRPANERVRERGIVPPCGAGGWPVSELAEILAVEDLTVEQFFYELLLLETRPTQPRTGWRRRISNRPRDPHHRER